MKDAEEKIEAWREEYNNFRPHNSLNSFKSADIVKGYNENELEENKYLCMPAPDDALFFFCNCSKGPSAVEKNIRFSSD